MQLEVWKSIPSQPDYEASDLGRIRRITSRTSGKAGHILKAVDRGNGYLCVTLPVNGKWRNVSIHRLIAETFLPKLSPEADTVNHLSGNRQDNRAVNLEWVEQSENVQHAYRNGFQDRDQNKGENNGQARLTEEIVRTIRFSTDRSRGYQSRFAREFGITRGHVSEIVNRKVWRHVEL